MELTIVFRSGPELRVTVTPDVAVHIKSTLENASSILPPIAVYQSNGRLLCFRPEDVLYIV